MVDACGDVDVYYIRILTGLVQDGDQVTHGSVMLRLFRIPYPTQRSRRLHTSGSCRGGFPSLFHGYIVG